MGERTGVGRRALVIDCDPGVDDAVAIAIAAGSPELDLLAVTTVTGNMPLEVTTANALALLHVFGLDEVRVAAGASRALVRRNRPHPPVHGANGIGGVRLAAGRRAPEAGHAVDLLTDVLRSAPPRSVTVAALAPLTNIALFLALRPELADRIDRILIMGGAIGPGNITPTAEFNFWADPEAAQSVLDSELDVCLVALHTTRRATLRDADLRRLREMSARGASLANMIAGHGDRGPDGWRLHDALVLAAIIEPSVITERPALVEVDTGPGIGRAQSHIAFDIPLEGWAGHGFPVVPPPVPSRVKVADDLDPVRFRELVLECVARLG